MNMKEKLAAALLFVKQHIMPYIPAILIVGFVVWHLFFLENNSYLDICQNDVRIRELKQEIAKEEALIEQLQEEINNSESDIVTIDRIAREKHGMQLPHEDVYIIVEAPVEVSPLTTNSNQ